MIPGLADTQKTSAMSKFVLSSNIWSVRRLSRLADAQV
jgi:hypothetical protein